MNPMHKLESSNKPSLDSDVADEDVADFMILSNNAISSSNFFTSSKWPAAMKPSAPAELTSAASKPPDTPAMGALTMGRRQRKVLVNGVVHCLRAVVMVFLCEWCSSMMLSEYQLVSSS